MSSKIFRGGRGTLLKKNRPLFFVCLAIIGVLLSYIYFIGSQLVVSIYPDNNQKSFCIDMKRYGDFSIVYTHSVQKTPVEEIFKVYGINNMIMYKTIYQSYGVGLPYLPSEGKFIQSEKGKFVLLMNRKFKNIYLRTGLEAKPKINHNNDIYNIYSLYDPGTLVIIKAEKKFSFWTNKIKEMI